MSRPTSRTMGSSLSGPARAAIGTSIAGGALGVETAAEANAS